MTERQKIVRKACEEFTSMSTRTLARALLKKHPRQFANLNIAELAVRAERGAKGKESSKNPIQRTTIPESFAEPWEPIVLDTRKLGVLSDVHIPYHDRKAIHVAVKDLEKTKIDTLLINGDLIDFYQISRFDKSDKRPSVKRELQLTNQFFKFLRERFKKARFIFKLGNHEERWDRFIRERAPEIFDLTHNTWQEEVGINEYGVEVVDDGKIILAGKLPILHGHELPKGITNPVNPARGAFLRTLDSVLISHHHRTSEHTERSMLGRVISTSSMGCLCDLSPSYARINRWDHGFAVVLVSQDGGYNTLLKKVINGKVFG